MFELVIFVPVCQSPSSWEQKRFTFASDEQRFKFNTPRGWLTLFDIFHGKTEVEGISV